MFGGMLSGVVAAVACLSVAYASAQPSFDPRSVDRMPTENELPSPGLTPDQIRAECRLFAGKKYSAKMATQPDGTAALLYVNGSLGGNYPVKANNRRFPGKIDGNMLKRKQEVHGLLRQEPPRGGGSKELQWGLLLAAQLLQE